MKKTIVINDNLFETIGSGGIEALQRSMKMGNFNIEYRWTLGYLILTDEDLKVFKTYKDKVK